MRRSVLAFAALALWLAADAAAWVPSPGILAGQVARSNRSADRSHSLVLTVALRGEGDRKLGDGELATDPRGLARLELRSGGRVERHLLRGGEHLASSGSSLLSQPPPVLPPLFFLQVGSGQRLLSGLVSLGGSVEEIVLGRHEDAVCYVLGGRDLAPAANASASEFGSPGRKAAVWIERDSFRIVRIDRLDGTRYTFGPERDVAGTKLPGAIRIERPGVPPVRLEILDARRGRFDLATTFGMDWLLGR
ncbi:MAG: hypothetical protein HKP30_07370 [Myxococcales bacterium]|nr:hypothetical protein [Myxococcales bacterium]